ncbi:MAG: OmpA family protein [Gammaproteobacteria bacterium]|nr:OmpA family protein [Gammaproteobacteria bacterium]
MKKSLINFATSMAISSTIFTGSVLFSTAHADSPPLINHSASSNNNSNDKTTENYMLPGMGVGAATGVVIAGPVGLVVGSLIGAFVGAGQDVKSDNATTLTSKNSSVTLANDRKQTKDIITSRTATSQTHLAQLGSTHSAKINKPANHNLVEILTTELSLDIYFRSGGTNIETFYTSRLTTVADMVKSMDNVDIHLEGYTDRRGNKKQNIALANRRVENVRQQLINAGILENRINSKVYGEKKMVSRVGDLEAYAFDRKVVISFKKSLPNHDTTAVVAANTKPTSSNTASSVDEKNTSNAIVADMTAHFLCLLQR